MSKHHCHNHSDQIYGFEYFDFLGIGEWGLVLNLFIMGFLGSFVHCIGMCGPFSLAISQMRVMALAPNQASQANKLMAIFAAPYYLGKASTYTILALCAYFFAELTKDIIYLNFLKLLILFIMAFSFIMMGIYSTTNIFNVFSFLNNSSIINWIDKKVKAVGNQFGLKGFLTGMILGLIPCGLVFAAITKAISTASNAIFVAVSIFTFGIATIVGLFIISFTGNLMLNKISKLFLKFLYAIIMFYNAFLLIVYALKLI